jgi:hypothetical protein
MRKAIFASLAVLCSYGMATDAEPAQKNHQEASAHEQDVAGCGRSRRGRRVAENDDTQESLAARRAPRTRVRRSGGCGSCCEASAELLAGKCKDGNCNRGGRRHSNYA